MGDWVIAQACRDAQHWRGLGFAHVAVAVNVSAKQFQNTGLASYIETCLDRSGLPSALLDVELTESAVMVDPERALNLLNELHAVGVGIALDDFGTGYSSLGYLKRFPVGCLKIDQSFVRDINIDPDDAAIAKMVVALGHSLRQYVVAEGVETRSQLDFLKQQQCDQIQGYYFSPPVPLADFVAMLQAGRTLDL